MPSTKAGDIYDGLNLDEAKAICAAFGSEDPSTNSGVQYCSSINCARGLEYSGGCDVRSNTLHATVLQPGHELC